MKKLLLTIPMVFMFNACSTIDGASPSQNKTVQMISGDKAKKPGAMQNALDNWLKNEWNPATSSSTKPTANTKVKVVEREDGTAKLVEIETGVVLKEMTKEEVVYQKEIQVKYESKSRNFTLQEYVDKMAIYNSSHITDDTNSHNKMMDSLPVIGKSRR